MLVYKITNLINGKMYVGQTTRPLNERWASHGSRAFKQGMAINYAIEEFGRSSFKIEPLEKCGSVEELWQAEQDWIKRLDTLTPNGYNIQRGGRDFSRKNESTIEWLKTHGGLKMSGRLVSGETNPDAKAVLQFDTCGNFLKTHGCIKAVAKECGVDDSHISAVCLLKKDHVTAGGFIWRHAPSGFEESSNQIKKEERKVKIFLSDAIELKKKMYAKIAANPRKGLPRSVRRSDGKEFPSLAEAGREIGVSNKRIYAAIHRESKLNGMHYQYI